MKSERDRELWNLPQWLQDQRDDCTSAEVWWHIFEVFGYETGVLTPTQLDELFRMFIEEQARATESSYRPSSCRAFVRFVRENGGPESFGLKGVDLFEWVPADLA